MMIFLGWLGSVSRDDGQGRRAGERDAASGDLREAGHPKLCAGRGGRDLVELREFLAGAGEADLQAVDLAEPALLAGFGDAGVQVVADLDQPWALCGVGAQQRAAQAGVFVR